MRKTSNFGHFGPKWPILDSFGPKREFFKKALGTFPAPIQVLPNFQVSEKSDEGAQDISERTYVGMHVWTDVIP